MGYRCVFRDEYPGDEHHPKSLFVAENRILPALDEWLRTLSCKNFEVVIAEMIHNAAAEDEEPPETVSYTHLDVYKRQPTGLGEHCLVSALGRTPEPSLRGQPGEGRVGDVG